MTLLGDVSELLDRGTPESTISDRPKPQALPGLPEFPQDVAELELGEATEQASPERGASKRYVQSDPAGCSPATTDSTRRFAPTPAIGWFWGPPTRLTSSPYVQPVAA